MRTFDLKQIKKFQKVFPELNTTEQLETAMLFSLGLTKKEIATMRDVRYRTVEVMLDNIKKRCQAHSLNTIMTLFQVRLVFFALYGCTVENQ
ncbi:MAG: hypothetical protein HamCj_19990 [Candidatus Hamiltonella defensa (Ceratovacuna japonica)]|uniref:helix-turn-helix transcriptional regulator n=1 Tax=Candidatus Williamhamiltonella defendens TaxID=138072 RepID=UPI001582E239|nr:transcriptional regulator [Candidatus Hamiltonella defensa]